MARAAGQDDEQVKALVCHANIQRLSAMKNATPDQESSVLNATDTSAHTQRAQIIALIKQYQSRSTPEFREHGIMSPAPRILELRAQGHKIEKVLETFVDKTGKTHWRGSILLCQ